jgi:hypothetical protein
MKIFNIIAIVFICQSTFALTGIVKSKILGDKSVKLDLSSAGAMLVPVTASVSIDHDTQDLTCEQYLLFEGAAQSVFTMGGVRTQESLDFIVSVTANPIASESECIAKATDSKTNLSIYLRRVLNPQFVISQSHENDQETQTILVLSSANNFVTADLAKATFGLYSLKNIQFPKSLIMNFSVIKTSPGAISYLEHGTLTFN